MAQKKSLIIIGSGGHARVVTRLAFLDGHFDVVGAVDRDRRSNGEKVDSTVVVGTLDDLPAYRQKGIEAAAISFGDNNERSEMAARLLEMGYQLPSLIHPSANVETTAEIGDGTIVCAGAIIGTEVSIGTGCIINTGAIIDHESRIGSFSHVGPGCRLAGRVTVGDLTFVGIGTVVKEKIRIGERTIIGAGSVVVDDIPSDVVAKGIPARIGRKNETGASDA